MRLLPLLLLTALACDGVDPVPSPPPDPGVPQRAGVLYEAPAWTRPAGTEVDRSACGSRRSLVGCEHFPTNRVLSVAVQGQRLVAVFAQDSYRGFLGADLVISDDLGKTVRRFSLAGVVQTTQAALYLQAGRVFLLVALPQTVERLLAGAALYEFDPVRGTLTARGEMSETTAAFAADGVLTAVDYVRTRPPQVIAVTSFDPRTNRVSRTELTCASPDCEPSGLSNRFLSDDGETFHILKDTPLPDGPSCLVTVKRGGTALATECFPRFPSRNLSHVSSLGGTPFDFEFSTDTTGAQDSRLVPVARHWLPAGPPLALGPGRVEPVGGSFLVASRSGFTVADDPRLLRLRAGGQLQETAVQYPGCLNLSPYTTPLLCPRVVSYQALGGDEVLLITERDDSQDPSSSRPLFEVTRTAAPFTDYRP